MHANATPRLAGIFGASMSSRDPIGRVPCHICPGLATGMRACSADEAGVLISSSFAAFDSSLLRERMSVTMLHSCFRSSALCFISSSACVQPHDPSRCGAIAAHLARAAMVGSDRIGWDGTRCSVGRLRGAEMAVEGTARGPPLEALDWHCMEWSRQNLPHLCLDLGLLVVPHERAPPLLRQFGAIECYLVLCRQ